MSGPSTSSSRPHPTSSRPQRVGRTLGRNASPTGAMAYTWYAKSSRRDRKETLPPQSWQSTWVGRRPSA
eukprot:163692-Lingulodinium_polyedra.AAC.1